MVDAEKVRNYISKNFSQEFRDSDRFVQESSNSFFGESFEIRDGFTQDKDKIIYSKAFKRLQYKAQVYFSKKANPYQTRLTHTLEVNHIAKAISKNLGLNENLTEAIALGHDIGHTPFGHSGENTLDNIMRGYEDLEGNIPLLLNYGGFKHNFNSLKILDKIEERYDTEGLNLSWQILDGVLKHTSISKKDKKWDFNRFIGSEKYNSFINYDFEIKYGFPFTLEGQVVAIADEIAQREHDLDDSLRDELLLKLTHKGLFESLLAIFSSVEKLSLENDDGYDLFIKLKENIITLCKSSKNYGVKWKKATSMIISYFIRDVTENSMILLKQYDKKDLVRYDFLTDEFEDKEEFSRLLIIKNVISFSKVAALLSNKINLFIKNRTINSFKVSRFDGKAEYIIRQLFKTYYQDPNQMHKNQLRVLENQIYKVVNNYKETINLLDIDFNSIKFDSVDIDYAIDYDNLNKLISLLKLDNNFDQYMKNKFDIGVKDLLEIGFNEKSNKFNCIYELHYCYLSVICDYISQMTDSYAFDEYEELYLV